MTETTSFKKDLGLVKMKPYLKEGEVFIGNWADDSSPRTEGERTGWEAAIDMNGGGNEVPWKNIRVVETAFDVDGNKLKHSVALVGTPK